MNEIKAVYTGAITGGTLGWGVAVASIFIWPGVEAGMGIAVIGTICGAVAGGFITMKIAEKMNRRTSKI